MNLIRNSELGVFRIGLFFNLDCIFFRCYYLNEALQDWWHNKEFCENQNSKLISIDSRKQAEFIVWIANRLNKESIINTKTLTPLIFIGTVFKPAKSWKHNLETSLLTWNINYISETSMLS